MELLTPQKKLEFLKLKIKEAYELYSDDPENGKVGKLHFK